MRAIVTGGAGFIGSHVADALLARGDEVAVVDNLATGKHENLPAGATFHEQDIRADLAPLFEELRPEVVFHLAAQADVGTSALRPDYDAEVNVLGTVRVLEGARTVGARVVFASTGGALYGECDGPADEDYPKNPLSPYGTAKLAAEHYLETWNRLHGTSHVTVRFGNVYGARQDSSLEGGVVAIFLERMARGEETLIFGDGGHIRDYVYVGDVARAMIAALGATGGAFNVGTGVETSVAELHELCRRVSGNDTPPRHVEPRMGDVRRSVLDASRAERELGWRAEMPLEDGLRETWAWTEQEQS